MNINSSLSKTPIAVIGLSAIFADARNVQEFWTNIVQGKDSITEVPESRWRIEDYYDPDMSAPDKTYCKMGGFMPKIDFNPLEFGLPPNILEVTDASQLLGLVAARDAFKDAGYGPKSSKFSAELKEKTGVLLGVGGGQKLITPLLTRLQYPIWEKALRASGISENDIPPIVEKIKKAYVGWNENSFPGLLGNVISGRITNRFDLGGINSVVDAACAASLSAIKMALSELVEGRADMMLTGGVDTDNSPFMYMSFSKTPAFSKKGKISPFSDDADGMLIGEGIGMMVLKRLEDAERDGDTIYTVIQGVGTSSDGRYKSVYAPRATGQALAMKRAYEDANYPPNTVGLLEAHGTGTGAGDPTELNSMEMVFGQQNEPNQHIALGSVKSQIGHTKSAAGAAGMIKAVLALHHKILPPTINVVKPNTKFDFQNSALYINTETRPWIKTNNPRRAGVSAFGFGGINVHIALEEYKAEITAKYKIHQPYHTLILQSKTSSDLHQLCTKVLSDLKQSPEETYHQVIEKSKTASLDENNARVGFVVSSITECIDFLEKAIPLLATKDAQWVHPNGIYYSRNGYTDPSKKVVALFSGQGSQYVGMGKELTNSFPTLRKAFERVDHINSRDAITKKIFPNPVFSDVERKEQLLELTNTKYAQPAIGTLSMGMYDICRRAGFKPDIVAGHSFGELTALWAAGVYDDDTFLRMAIERGRAMSSAVETGQDTGTMIAVKESKDKIDPIITHIPQVEYANFNAPSQTVLGGPTSSINLAAGALQKAGITVIPLPVSAAFHTPLVAHAQKPFALFIEGAIFHSPTISVYSNSTGNNYPMDIDEIKTTLQNQILTPVKFQTSVENMYAEGARIFVEFGPKGVLTNLVKNILKNKPHTAIALNPNPRKNSELQFLQAITQLKILGIPLNEIDIEVRSFAPPAPKTKLNVELSAYNYVSPKTKQTYEDSLNDGKTVSSSKPVIVEKIIEKIVEIEKPVEVEKIIEVEKLVQVEKIVEVEKFIEKENSQIMNQEVVQILKSTLESFNANQTKTLAIFEKFMNEQSNQSNELLKLLSAHLSGSKYKNREDTFDHDDHSKPLTPGYDNSRNGDFNFNGNSNGNGHHPAPSALKADADTAVAEVPATVSVVDAQQGHISTDQLSTMLLEVVSEKTGYPAEMLELNMDMEADLGIDSIKRVEIFGALTEKYPDMADIDPNELTELRTLGEIVNHVTAKASGSTAPQRTTSESTLVSNNLVSTESLSSSQVIENNTTQSDANLAEMLLEVVSEKTGYPAEMLELNMDMEADLGIDSIKRVEIFGALTEKYPSMADIDPNELTELRTLGEIVEHVKGKK